MLVGRITRDNGLSYVVNMEYKNTMWCNVQVDPTAVILCTAFCSFYHCTVFFSDVLSLVISSSTQTVLSCTGSFLFLLIILKINYSVDVDQIILISHQSVYHIPVSRDLSSSLINVQCWMRNHKRRKARRHLANDTR